MRGHPVLSMNEALFYHLDEVNCSGYEMMLSECGHNGIGNHNCFLRTEEAGVICDSKTDEFVNASISQYVK